MSMRRIDRYIVQTIAASMILVLSVVLSLDLVFAFIAEMEELKHTYQVAEALVFVLTTIPRRIYDYLPLAAFMGALIGLGALAKNSELVVIRAAGASTGRIIWSAMKPVFVVVVLGGVLGEFIAPYAERIAQSKKAVAQGASQDIVSLGGLWHREGDAFIHFNAVEPNGVLHGVTIQRFEGKHLVESKYARRAIYQRDSWLLENIKVTQFQDGRALSWNESYQVWGSSLTPSVLSVLMVKPDNLSISGLYSYSSYLVEQELNASQYMMSFWKKSLQPLSTAVLVFVAISFVFGPLRSVTMGFRVFSGLVVGLVFKYMQDLLGPSSLVFGFNPIWATLIPVLICLLVGFVLMRKAG